jgi:hypothetical protein
VYAVKRVKTIKVDEETHEKLWILLLELQAKWKKPLNMGDVVKYLLEHYEKTCGSK